MQLDIKTPRWFLPLLDPRRYKGAKGGRGSGKSHAFAELAVEAAACDPNFRLVCIREIQKSLKFSAKVLIEQKIRDLGVSELFEVTQTEIRRRGGNGIIIFQGMQDHTADSIKSLEGFDAAWVEEAQNLSSRSLRLLRPTIRKQGSELWFSWNPENDTDPVDVFFREMEVSEDCVCVHVNYTDNPFLPDTLRKEAELDLANNPDDFDHIWLGGYNKKSHAQVFHGKWTVREFEPKEYWDGPYFGMDFGFANDPSTATKSWIGEETLWVEYDAGSVGLELDQTAQFFKDKIPGIEEYDLRADSARPESISYLKRNGLPRITPVSKGKGSIEDGVAFIKSFKQIVIHPRCEGVRKEAKLYCYKIDQRSGDILPTIVDAHNHYWDSVRYALEPIMKQKNGPRMAFV